MDADAGFPTPSNGVSPIPKIPKEVTRTKLPGQDITEKFDRSNLVEKSSGGGIPLNLYKKIHKIIAEDIKVGKDGRNDFHKYDYTTEASVVEAMRDVFSKHNLAYDFDVEDVYQVVIDGKEITRTRARITLIDLDTGEFKVNRIFGDGQDKGDKGVYKSYTGLQKYYFMKSFLLSTGDDPEKESGTTQSKAAPAPRSAAPTQNAAPSEPGKGRSVSLPARRVSATPETKPAVEANTQQQAAPAQAAPTSEPATSAKTSAETAPVAAQPAETPQQNTVNTSANVPATAEAAPAPAAEKKPRAKFNPPKRAVKTEAREE